MTKRKLIQLSEKAFMKKLKEAGKQGYIDGHMAGRAYYLFDTFNKLNYIEDLEKDIAQIVIGPKPEKFDISLICMRLQADLKMARESYKTIEEIEKRYFNSPTANLRNYLNRFNETHSTLCALIAPYLDKNKKLRKDWKSFL